jgi:DNA-binding Xre family transcriptional regulator
MEQTSLALGAASAGDRFHDLYLFSALVLDQVADEDQAVVAAVGPLQTGVVGVEGVVGFTVAVYSGGVHWASSLWAGLRGVAAPAGPLLYPTNPLYLIILLLSTIYSKIFCKFMDKLPGMEVDAVKVKELRERQVLSLSELEERSGVDRQIIWRIESGYQKGAHQKTIRKLAAALGVEPYELTRREG